MRSDAIAFIIGHLGQDAKVTTTPSGKTVATINVAVNRKKNDQQTTLWCKAEVWNPPQAVLDQLKKGAYVRVVGAMTPEEYTSQNGTVHKSFFLQSAQVIILGSRREEAPPTPARSTSMDVAIDDEDDIF